MTQKLAHTIQNLKISLLTALNSHFLKLYQAIKTTYHEFKDVTNFGKKRTVKMFNIYNFIDDLATLVNGIM